ncbi:unnamed protein product [marine sediment metagenome]|uniref:Uncharacterized protein n=1 Tax=marine sediment metagenome TaxID=412755 RepID=X1BGQ6_9ZZZZ
MIVIDGDFYEWINGDPIEDLDSTFGEEMDLILERDEELVDEPIFSEADWGI